TEMPWRMIGDTYYYNPDAVPDLTRLDIFTGKETRFGRIPVSDPDVLVDRDDVPRFAIGSDLQGRLTVAWRRTSKAKWEEFALPGFEEGTVVPVRFTPDNTAVLFTGMAQGERFEALFRLDLEDHSVERLIEFPDTDVNSVVMDLQDHEV